MPDPEPDADRLFAPRLRALRRERGLSQAELAERSGVSERTVSDLERGVKLAPQPATARMLADGLGLTGDERSRFLARPDRSRRAGASEEAAPRGPSVPLPVPLTSLVGREAELAELADLLAPGGARLVTLVGPGGVGKTRLALAVAGGVGDREVAFAALDVLRDPDRLPAAIAEAIGLTRAAGADPVGAFADALRGRSLLLVVDNAEGVVAGATVLGDLVRAAPGLTLLVTSRVPLGLHGETLVNVNPLPLPDPAEGASVAGALASDAVRLFAERAASSDRSFMVDERNATAVARLVRQLDGLPLAIELAAVRVRSMSPEAISERLGRGGELGGTLRDLPDRQRTLDGAIDWSLDLLAPGERDLFARLGVFAGSFTAAAVAAVAGPDPDAVEDGLEQLANASLLRLEPSPVGPRYRMLETVRNVARRRLAVSGQEASLRGAHATWAADLADGVERALWGPGMAEALDRFDAEFPDLVAAVDWLLGRGDRERAERLAGAIRWPLHCRGHWLGGRDLYRRVLAAAPPEAGPARVRCLFGHGVMLAVSGDPEQAEERYREARLLAGRLGDDVGIAEAAQRLGLTLLEAGDLDRATALFREAEAAARRAGDRFSLADAQLVRGWLALDAGDLETAVGVADGLLADARAHGDPYWEAFGHCLAAETARARGDHALALARARRTVDGFRRTSVEAFADTLRLLGMAAMEAEDLADARAAFADAVARARRTGQRHLLGELALALGTLALAEDDPPGAAWFLGATERLRAAHGAFWTSGVDRDRFERLDRSLREALPRETFAVAVEAGRSAAAEEFFLRASQSLGNHREDPQSEPTTDAADCPCP